MAAPDFGYYADQGPVHTFHLDEDRLDVASVREAVAAAHAAGRPEPLSPASRAAQRRTVAAAHAQMYRELMR